MLRLALPPLLAMLVACTPGAQPFANPDADTGDSEAELDAAPQPDADPSCTAWRLVHLYPQAVTLLETEALHVGRSARVRVELDQCPGDLPGLWESAPTLENEFLSVWSSVWRSASDCSHPQRVTRDMTLLFPYAGGWTVPADPPLEVTVLPEVAGSCGSAPPTACERDCDCASGERCLSGTDGTEPIQRCVQPCEFDRECGGQGVCGSEDGLQGICVNDRVECALPDRPCDAGFDCVDGSCAPGFVLSAGTRHECSCDSECQPGLRCVERQDGTGTVQRCEAVCHSLNDGWCQGPHSCSPEASVEFSAGVCGWVGD